ncbi:uncharacterized protein MONBRDRAFT_24683 [Monosiga brevicollis MX1]|uniref:Uncharacterized protein n=1 Tax=Monosiga brevicollis TaxID=81824 RepID=A9UX59_MONBE|nr:uncharacterized protein MONBRDRAFT_24683 [Monosiga brevicollis MX1]EDQ90333.1 predicted protein [Monosiga brevicollis MX1]|eukprot:XP_001745100.1 hypothetical protein [Monosiga brevicollis MX1]
MAAPEEKFDAQTAALLSKAHPFERKEFGYVQRSAWRHADRLDEEVVELDSPYTARFGAGSRVFTFLILGDQNAGKSTFLHAFTQHGDIHFLELSSLLPILASNFVNTRFLWEDDTRAPIDEPPFLDTDLGRATLVLSAEDFAFFVQEHDLSPSLILDSPPGTIYYVIQFLELGGDHLDQLMDATLIRNPQIQAIVAQSRHLLTSCDKLCLTRSDAAASARLPQLARTLCQQYNLS